MTEQLLLVGGVTCHLRQHRRPRDGARRDGVGRQQVNRSLAALDALGPRRDEVRRELDRPFVERVLSPILLRLSRLGGQLSPRDEGSKLRHRIDPRRQPNGLGRRTHPRVQDDRPGLRSRGGACTAAGIGRWPRGRYRCHRRAGCARLLRARHRPLPSRVQPKRADSPRPA